MKLEIDRLVDQTIIDYGSYENEIFENIDLINGVVIEYRCIKCGDFYFYYCRRILDYLKDLFNNIIIQRIPAFNGPVKCTQCNGKIMEFTII